MSSTARKEPIESLTEEQRRERLLRDLKLALLDQQGRKEGTGCNPYDALQGQGRRERWERRRR